MYRTVSNNPTFKYAFDFPSFECIHMYKHSTCIHMHTRKHIRAYRLLLTLVASTHRYQDKWPAWVCQDPCPRPCMLGGLLLLDDTAYAIDPRRSHPWHKYTRRNERIPPIVLPKRTSGREIRSSEIGETRRPYGGPVIRIPRTSHSSAERERAIGNVVGKKWWKWTRLRGAVRATHDSR